ncbi:hypothetical protein [Urbifossiella limnaea]|uniref:Uncharacterized protein n=1 Tax=Urbifossiella limnaea TaxID=2528023 RepID=A0A517Y2I2_9BACT|nr:hypothetical protein [Urbifossiella limnaea]QDU23980.1 hypothetical protein ETAA1_59910 [Urbifossiella limnaea]
MPPRPRPEHDDRPRRRRDLPGGNEAWLVFGIVGVLMLVSLAAVGVIVAGFVFVAVTRDRDEPPEQPPEVAALPPPRQPERPAPMPAPPAQVVPRIDLEPPPPDLTKLDPGFDPSATVPPMPVTPPPFVPPPAFTPPPFVRPPTGFPVPPAAAPRDWSRPLADVKPAAGVSTAVKLFGPMQSDGILRFTRLALDPPPPPQNRAFETVGYPGVCWSPKGDAGFVLTGRGKLTRFRHPGGAAERVADWDQDAGSLGWSAAGLVACLPQLHEVWVVNPDTLAVTRRVGVSGLYRVLTGPGLTDAFALCRENGTDAVVRVGLADGKLAELLPERGDRKNVMLQPSRRLSGAALAPDGKYLYAEVGISSLGRYRIEPNKLVLETATDRIISGAQVGACVSPDGKLVAYPSGGGNSNADGPYSTFVYRADDLSRPHATVKSGAYPNVMGFDPVGKRVYAHNYDLPLRVYDENGTHRGDSKLGGDDRGVNNGVGYVPHPNGRALLVRTNGWVAYVEFNP